MVPPIPERVYFDLRARTAAAPTPQQNRTTIRPNVRPTNPSTSAPPQHYVPPQRNIQQQTPTRQIPEQQIARDVSTGHWIQEVAGDGAIVKLDDGSIWEVDTVDRIDTSLWLATEEIILFRIVFNGVELYEMMNTDSGDNNRIAVQRLK